MTCFAFTPADLKQKKPKVAIVCQHEQGTFEVWLGDSHRKFQPEDIEHLRGEKRVENCRLSQGQPGIDSIIEKTLFDTPDFDHSDKLIKQTKNKTIEFVLTSRTSLKDMSNSEKCCRQIKLIS